MATYALHEHQAFFLRRVQSNHPACAGRNDRRHNVRSVPKLRSLVALVRLRPFRREAPRKRSVIAGAFAWRLYTQTFVCPEKIFANVTKPSTGVSSARVVGSIPASMRSEVASIPNFFRLCRSILRRWPKALSVTRCNAVASQARGSSRGVSRTIEDVTLGGGTNADRATSNRILASVRQPAKIDSRPYDFVLGAATIRSATSR